MNEIYLLLTIFFGFCLYYMLKNRLAIFFPSFKGMIEIVEKMANANKKDIVYDLGSGDGRVLEVFAKKGIECVGIEKNPFLNNLAKKRIQEYKNVKIIKGDIFEQDLSKATVVIAYLSRYLTKDLEKKIKKECKKGTRIILVSYKFNDLKPIQEKKWMWLPIRLYVV